MLKKIKIPKISLHVVINGPVATAGSIPFLCRIKGTKVPTSDAMMITMTKEILIVVQTLMGYLRSKPKENTMAARKIPFTKARLISLNIRFSNEPRKLSFASPCTMIAEDCTPTFPAMAAMSGVKKTAHDRGCRCSTE